MSFFRAGKGGGSGENIAVFHECRSDKTYECGFQPKQIYISTTTGASVDKLLVIYDVNVFGNSMFRQNYNNGNNISATTPTTGSTLTLTATGFKLNFNNATGFTAVAIG